MCKNRNQENENYEELLEQKKRLYEYFKRTGYFREKTLKAFLRVPREEFVPKIYRRYAYIDEPLPIGKDSTISAISMSLMLCEYAELDIGKRVLEIGTGSGYQSALISEIVCEKEKEDFATYIEKPVKSIEISREIYEFAIQNLEKTSYTRCVEVINGDGTLGWPNKKIKFDAIIVTAAGEEIPKPLIDQLDIGGVLVMPLGTSFIQKLVKLRKISETENEIEYLDDVRFVFLKGKYGVKD